MSVCLDPPPPSPLNFRCPPRAGGYGYFLELHITAALTYPRERLMGKGLNSKEQTMNVCRLCYLYMFRRWRFHCSAMITLFNSERRLMRVESKNFPMLRGT